MMKLSFKHVPCAVTLLLAAGLCSCVDGQYDLSDVDTDDITIGNELILPLGTGTISAGELLDVKNNDVVEVDAAGNYVLRYNGEVALEVPAGVGFTDSGLAGVELNIPFPATGGNFVSPEDIEIPLDEASTDISFETTDIGRLDSVLFDNTGGKSRLRFTFVINGLRLVSGTADVVFNAQFPDGYRLAPETARDGTFADGNYRCTLALGASGQQKKLSLLLEKAVIGTGDELSYNATLRIRKGTVIAVTGNPRLAVSGQIASPDYRVVYGQIDGNYSTEDIRIETGGISDLFEGDDNVLSFYDPRIRLEATSDIGVPLEASFRLTSTNSQTGQTASSTADGIGLDAPASYGQTADTRLWLGSIEGSQIPAGYAFERCAINDLIKISPDLIRIQTDVKARNTPGRASFFPKDARAEIAYTAEIPLAPAADFRARTDQSIEDVFDQDLVDYLFSGGSVTISGSVTNTLPVNFDMNLVITDRNDKPVGIVLEPQRVAGSPDGKGVKSDVAFTITGKDMPAMKNARNIRLALEAFADDKLAGKAMRPDQQVTLLLKIHKSGGITIQ